VPATLSPVLNGQGAGWKPDSVCTVRNRENCFVLSGNRTQGVQLLARRCTKAMGIFSIHVIVKVTSRIEGDS
jgi:hypothetical protein